MIMSFENNEVTLIVGQGSQEKSYKCCRIILASQSDVFKAMFYGPLAERNDFVRLPCDDPEVFEQFIKSVSENKMNLKSPEDTIALLYLADKYLTSRIKRQCCTYLKQHITTKSVCTLLQVAQILHNYSLSFECWKYILFNASDVLASKEFADSPLDIAQSIVLQDQLNVSSELQVYEACINWSIKECSRQNKEHTICNIREVIKPVLHSVRYALMDYNEFVNGPFRDDILTDKEKLEIITHLSNSELRKDMKDNKEKRQLIPVLDDSTFVFKYSCTDFRCHSKLPFLITERYLSGSNDLYVYGISIRCVSRRSGSVFYSGTQTRGKLTIKNISRYYEVEKSIFLRMGAINFAEADRPVFVRKGESFEIVLETKERVDCNYCRSNRDLNSHFGLRIPQYDEMNFISTRSTPSILKINV